MMIEAYADLEQTMDYYGNDTHPAGHFPFNFLLITELNNESSAFSFKNTVNRWISQMTEGRWANWVVSLFYSKQQLYSSINLLDSLKIMTMVIIIYKR